MIRKITILFISCFVALAAIAQTQTFTGMLVGGFNMSQIDGDRLHGFNKLGLHAGVGVDTRLSERWSLGLELLFSQQGASMVPRDDISSTYDKIKLNFVEAPLMIHFRDWKMQASAGVSYGRLVNYEVINDVGSDVSDLENYRTDIPSILFGGTYFFHEKWGLNVRWSKYLVSLKKDKDENSDPVNFHGRTIAVRMFYLL
ncbi:MAG: porin family protein [Saprospiraceae bacterium]